MSCYLVQEEDGTSRFILEDGSGFLLLEECEPPPAGGDITAMGDITPPQRVPETRAVMYRIREDEDEFVLYLLTRL